METFYDPPVIDERFEVQDLFQRLKDYLPTLEGHLSRHRGSWEYDDAIEHPPNLLPSGWAALLYLYGLR